MNSYKIIDTGIRNPEISIAMLAYNHCNYITQAIESILMQKTTYTYKIIIAEDNSSDDTRKIILDFQSKFPEKFKIILQNQNVGANLNNFALLSNLEGKYIAVLEGDDYWTDPYKLQKQVDFLENNPDFILTSGNVIDVVEPNKEMVHHPIIEGEFSFDDLVKQSYVSTLTAVFRNLPFPKDYWSYASKIHAGDYPLYFMLLQHGKLKVFPDNFGCYRRHSQGVFSQKSFVEAHELAIQSNKIIVEYHKSKGWKYKAFYASIGRSNYYCLENALKLRNKKKVKKYLIGLLLKIHHRPDFSKKILFQSVFFLVFSRGKN